MKLFSLIVFIAIVNLTYSQEIVLKSKKNYEHLSEYTASNNITYKIGDKIQLGKGSRSDGQFEYLREKLAKSFLKVTDGDDIYANGVHGDYFVKIKKIVRFKIPKRTDLNGKEIKNTPIFVVKYFIGGFHLDIEGAISTCEVKKCKPKIIKKGNLQNLTEADRYELLFIIKKLLDEGILTQKEYKEEKNRILQ